jgi:hypothetical protein
MVTLPKANHHTACSGRIREDTEHRLGRPYPAACHDVGGVARTGRVMSVQPIRPYVLMCARVGSPGDPPTERGACRTAEETAHDRVCAHKLSKTVGQTFV